MAKDQENLTSVTENIGDDLKQLNLTDETSRNDGAKKENEKISGARKGDATKVADKDDDGIVKDAETPVAQQGGSDSTALMASNAPPPSSKTVKKGAPATRPPTGTQGVARSIKSPDSELAKKWLKSMPLDDDDEEGSKPTTAKKPHNSSSTSSAAAAAPKKPSAAADAKKESTTEPYGFMLKWPFASAGSPRRCITLSLHSSGSDPNFKLTDYHQAPPFEGVTAENTARVLVRNAKDEVMPSHALVLEHFGFSKVKDKIEQDVLLTLYWDVVMFVDDPPSAATMQQWQRENRIAKGLLDMIPQVIGGSRYFEWFKGNQHVVDQAYVRPGGPLVVERPIMSFARGGKDY